MPKKSLRKLPLLLRTAIAVGSALLLAFFLSLLLAAIAMSCSDPTANLTLYGEILFLLSILLCGFLGARLAAENRFLGGLAAVGELLLLTVIASLVIGTDSGNLFFVLAALGAFFGAIGALLGAKEKKRSRSR